MGFKKKSKFNLILFSFALLITVILFIHFIIDFLLLGIFLCLSLIIFFNLAILDSIEYLPNNKNRTKLQSVYIDIAIAGALSFWISSIGTAIIYRGEENIDDLILLIVFLLCFLILLALFILIQYHHGWGKIPTHCEHCGEKLISQGAKVCPNCQKRIRRPRVWSDD